MLRILILALLPGLAAAQVPTTLDLFGETLVYPLPDWTDGMEAPAAMETIVAERQQTDTAFLIELVPAGQTLADWTDLMAVLAHRDGRSVEDDLDEIEANFTAGCAPGRLLFLRSDRMPDPPPAPGGFATAVCGAYASDPSRGEIAVFAVVEKDGVTARIYREWRGDAFDPVARTDTPVEMPRVMEINSRLLLSDFER